MTERIDERLRDLAGAMTAGAPEETPLRRVAADDRVRGRSSRRLVTVGVAATLIVATIAGVVVVAATRESDNRTRVTTSSPTKPRVPTSPSEPGAPPSLAPGGHWFVVPGDPNLPQVGPAGPPAVPTTVEPTQKARTYSNDLLSRLPNGYVLGRLSEEVGPDGHHLYEAMFNGPSGSWLLATWEKLASPVPIRPEGGSGSAASGQYHQDSLGETIVLRLAGGGTSQVIFVSPDGHQVNLSSGLLPSSSGTRLDSKQLEDLARGSARP